MAYIKDYATGRRLVEISDNYIKDYSRGSREYQIDGKYIKEYSINIEKSKLYKYIDYEKN